ncbi:ATP-binding cassette domain-containing protein [Microbacterium radiodurans]|uniref:ATP-binding cassette domain-containing protein n=2 Tax=Microbacterium radiodurans TaxID=661398 RepID=A0A5J5IUQ6_9MICO|nr:ATP-binding cassette domain-containing protein [Microbacterium radiodurans]
MPTVVEPDTELIDVEPAVEPFDPAVEARPAVASVAEADDVARTEDLANAREAAIEDAAAETVAIEWPVADPPEAVSTAEEPPAAEPSAGPVTDEPSPPEPVTEDTERDPADVSPEPVHDERDVRPDDDDDDDATLAAVLAVIEPAPEPESPSDDDSAAHAATTPAGESALRLTGLTKVYGDTRAVDAIDLDIPAGSFYGLVGPNGAGKTTTLSMIAGLLRPDAGSIRVAGIDLARDPARAKRQMGILPDRLRTFDRLTGRQLLYYYGVLRGLKPAVVENRISDLARAFDLADALGRSVSDYSAGMTKKVMLAGAMIHSPRLLVLDEPFEAVDPVSSAVILDILQAYVAHGGTVVLSSHGMDLVQRACSGVAVLVGGRVLADGTVDEVRDGRSLEQRFLELAGGTSAAEGLEWLHTFSD